MNELNYASLEASKKLVDNGIVLETEMYWGCQTGTGTPIWKLQLKNCHFIHCEGEDYPEYPAPCFTEVWRELPEETVCKKQYDVTKCTNVSTYDLKVFFNSNPTDALIELFIWLKGEGK